MTTAAPCAQPHEHPLKQNGDMSQGKATTEHHPLEEDREMCGYPSIPGN